MERIRRDGAMATLLKETTRPARFDGFGPSILVQQIRGRQKRIVVPQDRLEARKLLREECPLVPGVYGWLDKNRHLGYVGKSKSLRKRLLSYFAKTPADPKMDRIRQHSTTIIWEPISHELLALLREQELIHRWRPDFNSQGQPTRMQPAFLCIAGSPAPNARLVRRLTGKYLHAFGPISGTKYLRQAIQSFNQVFNLRDCPDKTKFEFQSQLLLFENPANAKCIRHELGTCPGPCAAKCSSQSYAELVEQGVRFLNGETKQTLDRLSARMQDAAARMSFESAAIYRDCLENLTWLDRRLNGLRSADQRLNGVLEIEARRGRMAWMVLRCGRIVATFARPTDADSAENTIFEIQNRLASSYELPSSLLEMSLQLIVISWFRKHPEIQSNLLSFDDAVAYCDQLSQQPTAA